ncbi:MAG: pectin acetylesterase-family hydrolase [Candidatus Binatia bacterium]
MMRTIVVLTVLLAVAAAPAGATSQEQRCEAAASAGLGTCVRKVGERMRHCYLDDGGPCAPGDEDVATHLARLEQKVLAHCPSSTVVQAAGYGTHATPSDLVARLKESCTGEPASIAARTFGGPQGAVLAAAGAATRTCLGTAAKEAIRMLPLQLRLYSSCLKRLHKPTIGSCPVSRTNAKVAATEAEMVRKVTAACPDLPATLGMTTADYAHRTSAQAQCMTTTANGGDELALDCGKVSTLPALGTWTQITLSSSSGALCGDGSPYAFWLKLSPDVALLDHVVVDFEGGGVCLTETGPAPCASVPTSLFQAIDNGQPTGGYMSNNPLVNPFADWTQIFLPYCTQDVHIGGGGQSVFTSLTVNRYGALNARAALRYLRGALWNVLEQSTAQGYRPDRMTVLLGGESAGAFGVQYNYHYVLDDLRWIHTTAAPDAGLALDNGTALSVRSFGTVVIDSLPPSSFAWLTKTVLPTYCLSGSCAVGPELQAATSVRLKAVPDQQILNISNQVDDGQVGTTFFTSTAGWINAARAAYCTNRGLNGIHAWLPAQTASYHTILRTDSRFTTVTAGGVTVRDWLADAIANPAAVVDRVDEGTLVADYPGVAPIACISSASGAFVD